MTYGYWISALVQKWFNILAEIQHRKWLKTAQQFEQQDHEILHQNL
jgi:hypothetical protein